VTPSPARELAGLLGYVALYAVLLFGPAGTFRWSAAWVLLAVLFAVRGLSTAALYRTRAELLAARGELPLKREPGQPFADRLLLPAFMAAFAAQIGFSAWDRWHAVLLPAPAAWLRGVGLVVFAVGWGIVHLVLRENDYALTVVRHQSERDQRVVETGPYAVVRHPMYAGLLLVMVGLALWLGSTAGAFAALVPGAVLAARVNLEERVLREALPEYAAYATRVRSRLVPRIW